jgi:hypothetical protein
MKRSLLVAAMAFLLIAPTASASHRGDLTFAANQLRAKVVKRHGATAAGRDIVKYGIRFVAADHSKQVRRPKMSELRGATGPTCHDSSSGSADQPPGGHPVQLLGPTRRDRAMRVRRKSRSRQR